LKGALAVMTEKGMNELYGKTVQGYLARLCSLEHFMKELKERIGGLYRFKSGAGGLGGGSQELPLVRVCRGFGWEQAGSASGLCDSWNDGGELGSDGSGELSAASSGGGNRSGRGGETK